jgi:small subunit ribosomal protein S6
MPMYEIMFIVEPSLEGEDLEQAIDKVKDLMEKDGGEIVNLKKMGKRRLAYEINDFRDGHYVLVNVQAGNKMVGELEHFFKVNEGYLRHIVFRMEENREKIEKVQPQEITEQETAEKDNEAQEEKKE